MSKRSLLVITAISTVLVAVGFWAGPRVDTSFRPQARTVEANVDAYLAREESAFHDLTPGTEKTVVWASPDHRRTPLSIVYLHGFSATRQELAPVCDDVARQLGANLFYTRLTGHGRTGAALAEAAVSDWFNDALEAVEIGHRLGERVIVIGTSTGGALATWLAIPGRAHVAAYVLIAPNYQPKDRRSKLLLLPWAKYFLPPIVGGEIHVRPWNAEAAKYWTTSYPMPALFPMMGVAKVVQEAPLETIQAPVLVLYCREDNVVDSLETERVFARIGSKQKALLPIPPKPGSNLHVIAGRIMAPDNTAEVESIIESFVGQLRLDEK